MDGQDSITKRFQGVLEVRSFAISLALFIVGTASTASMFSSDEVFAACSIARNTFARNTFASNDLSRLETEHNSLQPTIDVLLFQRDSVLCRSNVMRKIDQGAVMLAWRRK